MRFENNRNIGDLKRLFHYVELLNAVRLDPAFFMDGSYPEEKPGISASRRAPLKGTAKDIKGLGLFTISLGHYARPAKNFDPNNSDYDFFLMYATINTIGGVFCLARNLLFKVVRAETDYEMFFWQ